MSNIILAVFPETLENSLYRKYPFSDKVLFTPAHDRYSFIAQQPLSAIRDIGMPVTNVVFLHRESHSTKGCPIS